MNTKQQALDMLKADVHTVLSALHPEPIPRTLSLNEAIMYISSLRLRVDLLLVTAQSYSLSNEITRELISEYFSKRIDELTEALRQQTLCGQQSTDSLPQSETQYPTHGFEIPDVDHA